MTLTLKILVAAGAVLLLFLLYLVVLGQLSRSGEAPGMVGSRLSPCPGKPNCVCSEHADDTEHYIEALPLPGASGTDVIATLTRAVDHLDGQVRTVRDDYLAATFASGLFGFVDDVEFRVDPDSASVQVRSASRVGHSDLGANRKRIEAIRALLRDSQAL